jgi:hypothetical protein
MFCPLWVYCDAGLPAAQIASSPGAAGVGLCKAHRQLLEHSTCHRPGLFPVLSRRTPVTMKVVLRYRVSRP